ncbi:MAG TPA: hypothetical protein VMY37_17560 [Thermoguttaceae bacterium]|nr:hypothetical protein [Thermoguttaceae bacterium]
MDDSGILDPALQAVVAAWPTLAEATRAAIVRLVECEESGR